MPESSGKPKGAPKYKNSTKFRHNPGSKLTKVINEYPITGLCPKCVDKIAWRKDYRKYKPLSVPKKWYGERRNHAVMHGGCDRNLIPLTFIYSISCEQKTIKDAYHVVCRACASRRRICEKCLQPTTSASAGRAPTSIGEPGAGVSENMADLETETQNQGIPEEDECDEADHSEGAGVIEANSECSSDEQECDTDNSDEDEDTS
jgi:hypothetical protein